MTKLVLDRIAIEEVAANSKRLAAAIHQQLGNRPGAVPVHDIARGLDIIEIREERLSNVEAALITLPERGYGLILVNLNSNPQRRRYSVGHELLHFLNPWHVPTYPDGFHCSRRDMVETDIRARDLHRRQEAEANEFAIELLAPPARVRPYTGGGADLENVLRMAADLDISREAAARRYVALHDDRLAALFASNGLLRYAERKLGFPHLCIQESQPIPFTPIGSDIHTLSPVEEVDAEDWLRKPDGIRLWAQILQQREGFGMILLRASQEEDEDGAELADTFERFVGPGTRDGG